MFGVIFSVVRGEGKALVWLLFLLILTSSLATAGETGRSQGVVEFEEMVWGEGESGQGDEQERPVTRSQENGSGRTYRGVPLSFTVPADGAAGVRPATLISFSLDKIGKGFRRYREGLEEGHFAVILTADGVSDVYLGDCSETAVSVVNPPGKGQGETAQKAPDARSDKAWRTSVSGNTLSTKPPEQQSRGGFFSGLPGRPLSWEGDRMPGSGRRLLAEERGDLHIRRGQVRIPVSGTALYDPATATVMVQPAKTLNRYTTYQVTLALAAAYEWLIHFNPTRERAPEEWVPPGLGRPFVQGAVGSLSGPTGGPGAVVGKTATGRDSKKEREDNDWAKKADAWFRDTGTYRFTTGSAIGEPTHLAVTVSNPKPRVTEGGQLVVSLTDDYGDPATMGSLTFSGTAKDPSFCLDPVSQALSDSQPNGLVPVTVTDHKAEAVTVTATVAGPWPEDNHSVAVDLDFQPGPPVKLGLSASTTILKADGKSVATLRGTVTDAYGNAVPDGTRVDLVLTGGGTLDGAAVPTKDGHFDAIYTAGTQAGTITVTARAGQAKAAQDITLQSPVAPGTVLLLTITRNVDGTYALSGTATDATGNPLAGVPVSLSLSGSGTISSPTVTTDATGRFSAVYTPAATKENVTLTADAGGIATAALGIDPLIFGNQPWTDTGILIQAGQEVTVTTTGAWADKILARVGNGPVIPLGTEDTFVAGRSGKLYLGPGAALQDGMVDSLVAVAGLFSVVPTMDFVVGSAGVNFSLPADGKSTATINGRLMAGTVPVVGATIDLRLDPVSGSLSASQVVTDQDGKFTLTYTAGTVPGTMAIVGSYQQVEQRILVDLTPVSVTPAVPDNIGLMKYGGTATASTAYGNAPASFAFDGKLDTMWNAGHGNPAVLTRIWPDPVVVTGLNLYVGSNYGQDITFSVDGSNDGTTWGPVVSSRTVASGQGEVVARGVGAATTLKIPIVFNRLVSYRQLRLTIDLTTDWTNVEEWEILGQAQAGKVELSSDKAYLYAGGTDQAIIRGRATSPDGLPVPDGTEIALTLQGPGSFVLPGVVLPGVQELKIKTAGGGFSSVYQAGSLAGRASITAQFQAADYGATGSLSIPVLPAPLGMGNGPAWTIPGYALSGWGPVYDAGICGTGPWMPDSAGRGPGEPVTASPTPGPIGSGAHPTPGPVPSRGQPITGGCSMCPLPRPLRFMPAPITATASMWTET
ncbi:MAG: Ig-like domain-containing protein [Firmicutes bacterium]|nr:Ig-like domain-containing protein [Bacillota bacterium]